MTRWIGGIAVAVAMTFAGAAAAATPFNLGPGFSPDIKIDAAGKAHVGWIEERAETAASPSQAHYCRLAVTAQTCEAKAVGGPSGIGNYPHSIGKPLELFLNPLDSKPRLFTACYNCDHGGAQTSERIVAADGQSMALRTAGADPEGGGMVGDLRTYGQSAYDPAGGGFLLGTDNYYLWRMPSADPSEDGPMQLSPFPLGSGYEGATALVGSGSSQVQVAVYTGKTSQETGTRLRYLTHLGTEGVNVAANWQGGSTSIGTANEISTESGSAVTLLTTTNAGNVGGEAIHIRRFDAGTRTFGEPITIGSPNGTGDTAPANPDLFQATNGRLYAVWTSNGRIRLSTSADGVTWTFPETILNDNRVYRLRVAGTGAPDQGLVVWADESDDDGTVKAAPLSPVLAMVCPGDPRCPAPPQQQPQQPQQPEPPKPPVAPARGIVKKGTLSQYRFAVRAPVACVPASIKAHLTVGIAKRKLSKKQAKILKGKHVKIRRLALYLGAKRLAQSGKSPLNGLHDTTGLSSGALLKFQVRIVYTRGKKKAYVRKIAVPVTIC